MTEQSREADPIEYRFPDALRDLGRTVTVLDTFIGDARFKYDVFRRFVGHVDGIFRSGVQTREMMDRHTEFDKEFPTLSERTEKTLKFGRTTIHLADPSLVAVTSEGKGFWTYDTLAAQSMEPNEILDTFEMNDRMHSDDELIIIPPMQYPLDKLVSAVEERTELTPHIGYYVTYGDGYEGGYSWQINQYVPGMENRMEKHVR